LNGKVTIGKKKRGHCTEILLGRLWEKDGGEKGVLSGSPDSGQQRGGGEKLAEPLEDSKHFIRKGGEDPVSTLDLYRNLNTLKVTPTKQTQGKRT